MSFLRDTSISIKILIPSAVLILALGSVSLLAVYGLSEQHAALSTVHDIAHDRITTLDEFITLSEQVQSDVFRISVLRFMDLPVEEIQPVHTRLEQGLTDLHVIYGQILTRWTLDETERAILERMKGPLDDFRLQATQAAEVVADNPSFGVLLVRSSTVPFAEFRGVLTEFRDYQQAKILRLEAESNQRARMIGTAIIAIAFLIALAGISGAGLIGTRGIAGPIRVITDLMRRLAAGDLAIEIVGRERRDEIGAMARAVEVFRNNAIEKAQAEEALRESEERYRSVVETSHAGILIVDDAYRFLYVNDEMCRIVGYPREELIGSDFRHLLDVTTRSIITDRYVRRQRGEEVSPRYEFDIFRRDGDKRHVELSVSLLRDSAGNVRTVGQVLDITERKQAEAALHRRMEELTVLHAIALAGSKATSQDELVDLAIEVISDALYSDHFGVGIVDEAAGVLRVHPSSTDVRGRGEAFTIPLGQGVAGRVVATGESWRIPDVTSESAYRPATPGMRSELCVPLRVGARVIGVLNAESSEPDAFGEGDEQLMTTFAVQLATAIEKVRLFEAERRRAREAETLRQAGAAVVATLRQAEAIERILQELAQVVPHDSAVVQVLREGYVENVGGRGWPDLKDPVGLRFPVPGDNPNTVVIQQRRPIILADASAAYAAFREEPHTRVRSWLGVPLIVRDRVIGMLAVDSEQPNHFTPDHANLAAAFADQVAIAMENTRLFEQVRQLAITDPLTGLFNRRHFFTVARREFERARRYTRALSTLMLDVDHFKQVNDTYGHAAGDQVLRVVAQRCRRSLRDMDLVGRYGGEEFAILLPEADLASAQRVAEKLRRGIASPIQIEKVSIAVTVSMGVGALDEGCADLEALLDRADQALYAAKRAGRNCVRVWSRQ